MPGGELSPTSGPSGKDRMFTSIADRFSCYITS